MIGVSWNDVQAYCKWAGVKLPTEAQWEYACRAGRQSRFHSGDTEADLAEVGWFDGNSEEQLHPVGEKTANEFGLFDMHGNAWEWCEDAWGPGFYRKRAATKPDPVCRGKGGSSRVLRGGCFTGDADWCRSAVRLGDLPVYRFFFIGFRVALPAAPE